MGKASLYWAKKVTKRIELNKTTLKLIQNCIKRDKIWLKKTLKGLTKEEHLEYRYKIGDIEEADYQVIKQRMEDEKNG